jgi:hypothetical protein
MELEGEMPLEGRWVNLVVGLDRTLENLDLERLQHYLLRVDSQHDPLVLHTSNWCYVKRWSEVRLHFFKGCGTTPPMNVLRNTKCMVIKVFGFA